MGSINNAIHNSIDRIFTVPGQSAREERMERAKGIADEQNREINTQRKRISDEQASLKVQSDFRQAQYNRSVARGQRGRVRGGIFGDDQPQPAAPLNERLG